MDRGTPGVSYDQCILSAMLCFHSPWGRKESDTSERLTLSFSTIFASIS